MSEFGLFSESLLEKIMAGLYEQPHDVEEMLYSDVDVTSIALADVQDGTVPTGYEGLIVGVAVSSGATVLLYIKRDDKQVYENGLNCAGLSHVPQTAGAAGLVGVGPEVPLLIRIKEKGKWAIGFKATAATPTVNWRLRIRHYKKK